MRLLVRAARVLCMSGAVRVGVLNVDVGLRVSGSSLSLRSCGRLGDAASVSGTARLGSGVSVLDFAHLGSMRLLRTKDS